MQSNIVIKYKPYLVRAFIIIALFISSIASAVTLPIKMLRACIDYDNDIVTISWIPPTDDCGSFEKNVIYGSENLGPFEKIAEITDLSISEYPHALTVQNSSWRYYITTHTDCGGSDSLESDTIRVDITYPTNIELDSISYDLTTQNIIAGWQPNPSVDTKHYELYDYSSGSGDFLGKTSFLDFNISNVRGGRFPVVLATLDSCNLSSLLSTPHETTFLSGTIDTCTRSINLQWRRYIGWGDIDSQAVYLSINNGAFFKAQSMDGSQTTTLYEGVSLGDTLSFFVRSYKNNKSTSSNLNRFETRKLIVPEELTLKLVDVDDNSLVISWLCKKQKDTKEFNILFSEDNASFEKLIEIPTTQGNEKYSFTDKTNDPNVQSFYYYITSIDKCNNVSLTSETSASLFLDTSKSIIHNRYIGWESGVANYGIEKEESFTWNTHQENIEPFEQRDISGISGCFRITAKEQNQGEQNIAHSNVVCRVKPLTFYVTTAINPNSSNNRFVVKGEGIDKEKSEFLIYNRWGELISKGNLNQEWNGKYKNKKVSSGIYMYVIKVYGINGEYEQGKGTVNVIR